MYAAIGVRIFFLAHKKLRNANFSLGQTPTHPPLMLIFSFFCLAFHKKRLNTHICRGKKKKETKKHNFRQTPTHPKLSIFLYPSLNLKFQNEWVVESNAMQF